MIDCPKKQADTVLSSYHLGLGSIASTVESAVFVSTNQEKGCGESQLYIETFTGRRYIL
jgi:hypothetical protein